MKMVTPMSSMKVPATRDMQAVLQVAKITLMHNMNLMIYCIHASAVFHSIVSCSCPCFVLYYTGKHLRDHPQQCDRTRQEKLSDEGGRNT